MVRTRADNSARKAVAAKAPRKQLGSASGAGSSSKTPSKKGGYSSGGGGNPLRVCDIPSWQKGIGEFYPTLKKDKKLDESVESPDQPGGKCRKIASTSDSQPGCSSCSDAGSQMECETIVGLSDAEEREQGRVSSEDNGKNKTEVEYGNKENIPEQGSSKDINSDAPTAQQQQQQQTEPTAGSSSSVNDDEQPWCPQADFVVT